MLEGVKNGVLPCGGDFECNSSDKSGAIEVAITGLNETGLRKEAVDAVLLRTKGVESRKSTLGSQFEYSPGRVRPSIFGGSIKVAIGTLYQAVGLISICTAQ